MGVKYSTFQSGSLALLLLVSGELSYSAQPARVDDDACAKAESAARERGRPFEPDPGNAGEGMILPRVPRIF